jgi:hypothetical protein
VLRPLLRPPGTRDRKGSEGTPHAGPTHTS